MEKQDVKEEKEYFKKLLNKYILVTKKTKSYEMFYQGTVVDVFDDKIILDDRKLGEIPITFEGLSVTAIREVQR